MKTPSWVIPAAIGTAAGLAVVVISRLPFERIGAPPVKMPPPALVPVQVPGPAVMEEAAPAKAPEFKIPSTGDSSKPQQSAAQAGGLPQSELGLYRRRIDYLRETSELKANYAEKMRGVGALDRALQLLNEASALNEVQSCLLNQQKLKVTFYQAKATCMAATPAT